jgi:hypothetical protein
VDLCLLPGVQAVARAEMLDEMPAEVTTAELAEVGIEPEVLEWSAWLRQSDCLHERA